MSHYPLTQFACGHVGRNNEGSGPRQKVSAFIRVAEIRKCRIEHETKNCPDCGKSK